jgi:hypothetical protein
MFDDAVESTMLGVDTGDWSWELVDAPRLAEAVASAEPCVSELVLELRKAEVVYEPLGQWASPFRGAGVCHQRR